MFLVLPAAVVLTFWQGTLWAAWPALVVGLLGVILTPVALYRVESAGTRVPWWGYLGMGALTCKFLGESWLFVT
ncbi:hypothetical protein GCM10010468_66580 [Actinocorallia longicatena]|uniref:Uncharacterized protein n=2 Tax=Actinocorallia longicatena TaxID=111803 RepID=A0ABP6QK41_9ACTN